MSQTMATSLPMRDLSTEEVNSVSGGVVMVILAAATLALGIFSLGCDLGKQMAERDNAQ